MTEKISPDSPAFPTDGNSMLGVTTREYFALQILNGLISNPGYCLGGNTNDENHAIESAVNMADKLIERLNKELN